MFYFAWADASETTFTESAHAVEDESIIGFAIDHAEGDFPALTIDIENPRTGLLRAGRQRWAWLSYDDGSTAGVQPLFFGRLVGIPSDVSGPMVQLTFIARPADFDAQKRALAETLKVRPYWDPVWIQPDKRNDPDAVLEARSALWHIDRVTHEVTISSLLSGEDGTISLSESQGIYDSLSMGVSQTPLRKVRVEASVFWTQKASGTIDVSQAILDAAEAASSGTNWYLESYTGQGLLSDWPDKSDRIGGAWSFGETGFTILGRGQVAQEYYTATVVEVLPASETTGGLFASWGSAREETRKLTVRIKKWKIVPEIDVFYDASRQRTETIAFELESDTQALLTDPGEDEYLLLTLSSQAVGEPGVDEVTSDSDGMPLGNLKARRYLPTDRGKQSVEYLIRLAASHLEARSRAVTFTIAMPFDAGLDLSCRKALQLTDARLPGGEAIGKVVAYSLEVDSASKAKVATVTVACAIGQGNAVAAASGTPVYVEDGVLEDGIQARSGQTTLVASTVTYADFDTAVVDDGVDFDQFGAAEGIEAVSFVNGVVQQEAAMAGKHQTVSELVEAVNGAYSEIRLTMLPLNTGPYQTDYSLTVSDLMIPRQIDLEAT